MTDTLRPASMIGRQPVIGREQQLLAYTLADQEGWIAPVADTALTAEGLDEAPPQPGPFLTFIRADEGFLLGNLIEALPPALTVIELQSDVAAGQIVLDRCAALRDKGFAFLAAAPCNHSTITDALDTADTACPLCAQAAIIAMDLAALTDQAALTRLIASAQQQRKQLLARHVDTGDDFERARQLGFDLFQGYAFAHPMIDTTQKLKPAQASLLRLLALVVEDADTPAIEEAIKIEPALTLNLLRLTNSVGSGLSVRITSLRHAITVLGRRQLQRWLQLLLYAGRNDNTTSGANALLQLAATRGRLMELLAERVQSGNREFADQAFMTGILSLMPALLGVTMATILAQLPVATRIARALTDKDGQLGYLIALVEATESAETDALTEALRHLPSINIAFINNRLAQALLWAGTLGQTPADT